MFFITDLFVGPSRYAVFINYYAQAHRVYLTGTFNDWSTDNLLMEMEDERYIISTFVTFNCKT